MFPLIKYENNQIFVPYRGYFCLSTHDSVLQLTKFDVVFVVKWNLHVEERTKTPKRRHRRPPRG